MAHDHIREIVIRSDGSQQVGIKLRGVLDVLGFSGKQGKDFRIVDDLGPLAVLKQWRERLERFAFFVRPDRSPFAGFWRNFDPCDARPESFRFALTEVEIQPDRQRLFRRQLGKVLAKFRGAR